VVVETVKRQYGALAVDEAIPLVDGAYFDFLCTAISDARSRVWASIFIINPIVCQDPDRKVREILKLLVAKHLLGLDVRVIVQLSKQNPEIGMVNRVTLRYLRQKDVPARPYKAAKASTHAKYVVIDDNLSVVGSHNWTHRAFSENVEDSVALFSPSHNYQLAREFLKVWAL